MTKQQLMSDCQQNQNDDYNKNCTVNTVTADAKVNVIERM